MEKLRKIGRSHPILSIPVLAAVLTSLYGYILRTAVIGIVALKSEEYYGFVGVALAVVMLIIHKLWFRPEYKGSFRRDLLKEKSVIIPVAVYLVIDFIVIGICWITNGVRMVTIDLVGVMLMAGIGEEVSYRVIVLTTELRAWLRKGAYLPALIIASLSFGLGHILNLASGASLSQTVFQVFMTIAAGLFMGAVFLRTGNILYPIIIHTLHDMLLAFSAGDSANTLTLAEVALFGTLMVAQIIIAVWLLKGRNDEIIAIWKERWSISEADDTVSA